MATSLPQNAMESETTMSGLMSSMACDVISSRASVDETSSSVAKTLSLPTRSALSLSFISKTNCHVWDNIILSMIVSNCIYLLSESLQTIFRNASPAFFTKLKLRRAAREIQEQNYPKQIGVKYGFGSVQSFSKTFKREIGVSPREFFKGNYTVPDMPLRSRIAGIDIEMEYAEEHALSVDGTHIKAPNGIDTYLLDSYALPYSMHDQVSVEDNGCDKVGLWWYFADEGMTYVYGDVTRRFDTAYVPEGEEEGNILIQGGSYAVFSYRRPDDPSKISLMSRIMARYIFKEPFGGFSENASISTSLRIIVEIQPFSGCWPVVVFVGEHGTLAITFGQQMGNIFISKLNL